MYTFTVYNWHFDILSRKNQHNQAEISKLLLWSYTAIVCVCVCVAKNIYDLFTSFLFTILRNLHAIFCYSYGNLHSHQQCTKKHSCTLFTNILTNLSSFSQWWLFSKRCKDPPFRRAQRTRWKSKMAVTSLYPTFLGKLRKKETYF